MNFKYIDIHAHLNFEEYDLDRDKVIADACDAGVMIINVGTNLETSRRAVEIANKYPDCCRAIVGLHPIYVNDEKFDYESFKKLASDQMVVGIGECGLDYFHIKEPKDEYIKLQKAVFRQQIDLSIELKKPLMIHARDSYSDILSIFDDYLMLPGVELRGNSHFFAGSLEEAKGFLDRGFTMSFTGVVTFAKQYKELVEYVPLDMIMSETDCPYVTPVPFRGTRNEPKHIPLIVAKMAEIKGISTDLMAENIMRNANRLFGI
jgi:TatD DNase family protein